MIAIGGSIGTGLFVGSGKALATGGPASLVIAFSLVGVMMYCTVQALGEMAVIFPVAGSFSSYSTRCKHPSILVLPTLLLAVLCLGFQHTHMFDSH